MDVSVLSREEDGPKDDVIESMLRSAVGALKLNLYEEAMGRLEEIMECGTNNIQLLATIYMYYGKVCQLLKHDTKALEFFDNELSVFKLTTSYPESCESSRRVVEQSLRMGKFSKAKRCAEELIDYTLKKKDNEKYVRQARTLLVSVCLEGYERNMEKNSDEKNRLLTVSTEQISKIKLLNEDDIDPSCGIEILMLEAKGFALEGKLEEARKAYKNCIDLSVKTNQLANVHHAYYQMAFYAEANLLLFIINDLRSALFYATKYGKEREVAKYKWELADKLLAFGSSHEAYLYSMEALEMTRKLGLNKYLKDTLLIVSKCLIALEKNRQAAYFIVLGSVLTIKQDSFVSFYKLIDGVMTAERREVLDGEEVSVPVDASTDTTTPKNETVAEFVVKLEHATNVDTWRMVMNGIIEDQKKPVVVVEQKENEEPIDFMDLICKMNSRMDDQRTEMPAARFLAPRPLSSASKKTNKSHRLLPGLRANFAKMQNMKIDTQTVNRLLKKSKKSKTSLNSNSTQGDDTRSDDVTVLSK